VATAKEPPVEPDDDEPDDGADRSASVADVREIVDAALEPFRALLGEPDDPASDDADEDDLDGDVGDESSRLTPQRVEEIVERAVAKATKGLKSRPAAKKAAAKAPAREVRDEELPVTPKRRTLTEVMWGSRG